MKTSHGILALSAAALLMIAGAASAIGEEITPASDSPVLTGDSTAPDSPNTDDSGRLLLGIDIANAGNTPASVQGFIAGLSPSEQNSLHTNCAQILTDGSAVGNLSVVQFCQNLAG